MILQKNWFSAYKKLDDRFVDIHNDTKNYITEEIVKI